MTHSVSQDQIEDTRKPNDCLLVETVLSVSLLCIPLVPPQLLVIVVMSAVKAW